MKIAASKYVTDFQLWLAHLNPFSVLQQDILKRREKTSEYLILKEEKMLYCWILIVGLFWDKMNSEIFSYLEFHTVDEEKRAQVGKFVFFISFKFFCFHRLCDLPMILPGSKGPRGEKWGGHGWKDKGFVQKISCWKKFWSNDLASHQLYCIWANKRLRLSIFQLP